MKPLSLIKTFFIELCDFFKWCACEENNRMRHEKITPVPPEVLDIMQSVPPVRLCCGKRHFGPVCPDGKVMCCICFNRVSQEDLAVEDGQKTDVCNKCRDIEVDMGWR